MTEDDLNTLKVLEDLIRRVVREELAASARTPVIVYPAPESPWFVPTWPPGPGTPGTPWCGNPQNVG